MKLRVAMSQSSTTWILEVLLANTNEETMKETEISYLLSWVELHKAFSGLAFDKKLVI